MARLRAEVIAERDSLLGSSEETRAKLGAAIQRKQDQVARIVNAITDAGHNPALLAKLDQLQAEALGLKASLQALDDVEPPAPLEITEDLDAMIHAAAQTIERAISRPTHPDAPKLRGTIERITISRHESGAIEVGVRSAFAGVIQVAGLVERHAIQTTKARRRSRIRSFAVGGCGGRI